MVGSPAPKADTGYYQVIDTNVPPSEGENQTLVGYGPRDAAAKRRPRTRPAEASSAAAQDSVQAAFQAQTTEPAPVPAVEDVPVSTVPPAGAPATGNGARGSGAAKVLAKPPGSVVTMASAFTPYAGLAWGGEAISFQFHPEFEPDYAKALVDLRRERLDDADAAIASLDRPNDNARVAGWIERFLKS